MKKLVFGTFIALASAAIGFVIGRITNCSKDAECDAYDDYDYDDEDNCTCCGGDSDGDETCKCCEEGEAVPGGVN